MRQLLAKPTRPTAVICFNDDIAIGAMHEIHRQGLHVPNDISVVGFDNVKVSAFMNPPLTTIDQPAYEMGRRGMEVLSDLINSIPLTRSSEMLPFQLLERQSSGPAPV